MANIKHKNNNPFLLEDMAQYLEDNGFTRCDKIGATQFMKDDKCIAIYGDKVSFRIFDAGENDSDNAEFIQHSSFEGLSTLSINNWILLLHITGMITIPQLISNIKKQAPVKSFDIVETLQHTITNITTVQKILYQIPVLLVASLILFSSCNTQRQTQLQHGNVVIENGHIYFDAIEAYKQIPKDTVLTGFRVRNIAVKKSK